MRDLLRWKSLNLECGPRVSEPVQPPKNFDTTIQDKRFQDRVVNVHDNGVFILRPHIRFPGRKERKRTGFFILLFSHSLSLSVRHLMKKHEDGSGGE